MTSRSTVATAVAAFLLPTALGAHAADPPPAPELPRVNCTKRWIDTEGDAYSFGGALGTASQLKSDGLDIQSLFLRTTADQVQAFLKIKNVPTQAEMNQYDLGYRYHVLFTFEGKAFKFSHMQLNSSPASSQVVGTAKYPKASPAGPTVSGKIDAATDWVYMTVPRADIEKAVGGTAITDGAKLTAISAKTDWVLQDGKEDYTADELKPAATATEWTIGDDYCFGPPPGTLSDVTATAAQFGDVSTLRAKLVDEAGAPVADAPVTFTVGSTTVSGTTDSAGLAQARYTVAVPAGTHQVKVAFPGTATVGKSAAVGTLVAKAEVTKFSALAVKKTSTTARTVTAVLKDDDGKAVAKQKVGIYVNSKLVTTLVTDSTGKVVYKSAKAGQSVQARFAGVSGKYVAAKSSTAKV